MKGIRDMEFGGTFTVSVNIALNIYLIKDGKKKDFVLLVMTGRILKWSLIFPTPSWKDMYDPSDSTHAGFNSHDRLCYLAKLILTSGRCSRYSSWFYKRHRNQIANVCWIIKKSRSSIKTFTSALLTMPKPLTVWTATNSGKF